MNLSQRLFLLYKYSSLYLCRAAQASPFTRIIKHPIRRINHSVVASVSQNTLRPVGYVPELSESEQSSINIIVVVIPPLTFLLFLFPYFSRFEGVSNMAA